MRRVWLDDTPLLQAATERVTIRVGVPVRPMSTRVSGSGVKHDCGVYVLCAQSVRRH